MKIALISLQDRHSDDLRHRVAVQLFNPFLETLEEMLARFDDEKLLLALFHLALPAVDRLHRSYPVDTRREPLLHQSAGKPVTLLRRTNGHNDYDKSVHNR